MKEEEQSSFKRLVKELIDIKQCLKEQKMEIWWSAMIVFKRREDYHRCTEQLKKDQLPKFGIWEVEGLLLGDSAALYLSSPDGAQSFVEDSLEAIKKEYQSKIEKIKFCPVIRKIT